MSSNDRDAVEEMSQATGAPDGDAARSESQPGSDTAGQASDPVDSQAGSDAVAGDPQVEQLQAEIATLKDQALRAQAEMQNVRRRAERDIEQAHKYGIEKLVGGLLPVLDNLDRAIAAVNADERDSHETIKAIIEGLELTRKSALDLLGRFAVEALEPIGEPFDPQFHEAMTMVPSATAEPNTVIDVLQKGYTLHGRLLRAAMVVVAKAPE